MLSYRFDRHELQPASRRLIRDGRDLPVGLRVFDVIAYLVENRERVIGRDELIAAVWGRADTDDALLAQSVLKARRLFGDDGNAQHHIRTVPRFGYQWVAQTERIEARVGALPLAANAAAIADDATPSTASSPMLESTPPSRAAARGTPQVRRIVIGAAALALIAAIGALAWIALRHRAAPSAGDPVAAQPVPGLILVAPARVQSLSAEDGWMRLGIMALSARALAEAPGHAVVPDDTALAAVAQAGPSPDIERLRAATGASFVVTTDANHAGNEWVLSASVFGAGGKAQQVDAHAADPVAAASALARSLHDVFAPDSPGREGEPMSADVMSLGARMKAAILEGQNGRALSLYDAAAADVASAPSVILLRCEALIQLGRADEAAAVLHALVDSALAMPVPAWLPAAWTALGDSELARGHAEIAEAHFRRSIDLLGEKGDRMNAGLAWRGLGIAQAMRNDLDGAQASYLHARLQLEPIGDRLLLARITDGLGYIAAHNGRMADSLLLYEQAAAMAAAFGENETELGSRLNTAQSHAYLLHNTVALERIRALLPRLHRLDYPALHRFGLIEYVNALTETGAYAEARSELQRLDAERADGKVDDAVVDVRLDEAHVRLVLGDVDGAIRQAGAVRGGLGAGGRADLRLEAAATELEARMVADAKGARALFDDAAAWAPGDAQPPARSHALIARARWHVRAGDADAAAADYRQSLGIARSFGVPVVLRDAVVPYAELELQRGNVAAARAIAGALGPYAEDDFASSLLFARLAAANDDAAMARSYFSRARSVAGERWSAALAAEEDAAAHARVRTASSKVMN